MARKQKQPAAVVMLHNNWPTTFQRAGLKFEPGVVMELTAEQYASVKADIGKALVEVTLDEKNRPRVVQSPVPADPSVRELMKTIKAQQEAIDLLCEQVRELGATPVVDFADASAATEKTETTEPAAA